MVLKKSFRVWRKYRPRSVLLESKDISDEALLFESDAIAILSPVEVEIIRREYNENTAAYGCLGVVKVNVGTDTFSYLVLVTECQSVGKVRDAEVFRITQTAFAPLNQKANLEMVQEVGKLLACGRFYFSYPSTGVTFDLLTCAQKQGREQTQFFWNRALFAYMKRFGVDCDKWLHRIMCGCVEIHTVYAGKKQAKACLISRLSCERAGTRFNVRGTNDEGHVGNFVETEQVIYVDNCVASFVQIRGLVPLFWEQPGLQTSGGLGRIKFSRGYTCSQPAFERHFEWCLLHYGPLLCVNLLGTRNQEQMLSRAFLEHLQLLSSAYCADMVCFDYHHYIKGSNASAKLKTQLLPMIEGFVNSHSFFVSNGGTVERMQTGTLRTNCLDCLDRTNSVQSAIASYMLSQLMASVGLSTRPTVISRFNQLLALAWTHNGHNLSRMYTGSSALEGKMKWRDGARSVHRTIMSNFMDSTKQEAIDMLLISNAYSEELGQKTRALLELKDALSPVPYRQAMVERWCDYTTPEKLRVCIGSWNVNGGKHIRSIALRNQSMHDWLLDAPFIAGVMKEHPTEFVNPPDIFAIGFQELVGLTASNIVSASSSNRREWGVELQKVLSRDHHYELLTAEQLVGICLYIFIRPKLIPYIRDVAVSTVKTGMSGKAGNKGAVCIRFLLHSTSLCFVCSHFAAHQTKVVERNQDFADICRKVQFPHGQALEAHDYVFWCGDLNYRIDLPTQTAKDHIANRRWEKLRKQDQLNKQKKLKKVFIGYIEGDTDFPPTYKYDEFSDDYDTSEKCRTPAWCDRILWKRRRYQSRENNGEEASSDTATMTTWEFGLHPSDVTEVCGSLIEGGEVSPGGHPWHPGRMLYYGRAELKQSDHRPVVGIIEIDVYRVDDKKRSSVRDEVVRAIGPSDPTISITEREEDVTIAMPQLLDSLKPFGEVVLVRITDDSILATFRHSQSAMEAISLDGKEIDGVAVDVQLRTPWPPKNDEGEEEGGRVGPRRGRGRRHDQLKVLRVEQLQPEAVSEPGEEEEGLMEFSFSALLEGDEPITNDNSDSTEQGLDQAMGGMELGLDQAMGGMEPGLDQATGGMELGLDQATGGMEPGLDQATGGMELGLDQATGGMEPGLTLSSSSSEEDLGQEQPNQKQLPLEQDPREHISEANQQQTTAVEHTPNLVDPSGTQLSASSEKPKRPAMPPRPPRPLAPPRARAVSQPPQLATTTRSSTLPLVPTQQDNGSIIKHPLAEPHRQREEHTSESGPQSLGLSTLPQRPPRSKSLRHNKVIDLDPKEPSRNTRQPSPHRSDTQSRKVPPARPPPPKRP